MTKRSKLTPEGTCAECGCTDLMLASDQTQYTAVAFIDGEWESNGVSTEDMDSDDPLGNKRLFCTACGEYYELPKDLA